MADVEPGRIGFDPGLRPHAYDPIVHPELFEGVLPRRLIAFAIDVLIIAVLVIFAGMFILLFGLITLGLGWVLFWLLSPASMVWAPVLLRHDAWRSSIGHARHAGCRSRNAHLVRWAVLFSARRSPRYRLLGVDFGIDASGSGGGLAQWAAVPPT
jgi:hypothetical protein